MWQAFKVKEIINISEMYSLFRVHHPFNYTFHGETHYFWECVYVIKGKVCVSGDERIYNLTDNDMIFHKPHELHKFTVESKNGAELLIFSFSAQGELIDFFINKVFALSFSQINIINSLIDFLCENTDFEIANNDCNLYKTLDLFNENIWFSQYVVTYLYQLFLSLYDYNSITKASENPDAKCFSDAVSYMKNNIGSKLTIDDIAAHCHISPTGIKRIFKKYSGLSIHKYFLKLKINAASKYLKKGKSVNETSELLGFSDQSYFSYAYMRETGMYPSEFRKKSNNTFSES